MSSVYDQQPQNHPVLKDLQDRFFPFSPEMYPTGFSEQYHALQVRAAAGVRTVAITRYQSGFSNEKNNEKGRLVKQIRKWYGSAMPEPLDSWLRTTRPVAVFAGHGLPEEISLVCEQALKSGHVKEADLAAWAWRWIGLDCNGFVCFYYLKLGTFSRVLHKHIHYPAVTRPAESVSEVEYDSCVLWAAKKSGSAGEWRVKNNPSEDGAHIAVVHSWYEYGRSLWITERGGTNRFKSHVGIHTGIYDIVEAPPAGATGMRAIWTLRSRETLHGHGTPNEHVFITRRMQAY